MSACQPPSWLSDNFLILIPSPIVLRVSGRDARRYLNARLTNNIKELTAGALCRAAALSPQGRTQAYFTVLCEADSFLLICEGGEKSAIVAALKKFIVADRVDVSDLGPDFNLLHINSAAADSVQGLPGLAGTLPKLGEDFGRFLDSADGVAFLSRRSPRTGYDLLLSGAFGAVLLDVLQMKGWRQLSPEDALLSRIFADSPSFPLELNEEHILSEARIPDSISFTKGCYVGQEVIERIDAQGKTPKIIKRLIVDGLYEIPAGSEVSDSSHASPKSVGKILSAARNPLDGKTYCFASLKNEAALLNVPLLVMGRNCRLFN